MPFDTNRRDRYDRHSVSALAYAPFAECCGASENIGTQSSATPDLETVPSGRSGSLPLLVHRKQPWVISTLSSADTLMQRVDRWPFGSRYRPCAPVPSRRRSYSQAHLASQGKCLPSTRYSLASPPVQSRFPPRRSVSLEQNGLDVQVFRHVIDRDLLAARFGCCRPRACQSTVTGCSAKGRLGKFLRCRDGPKAV